MAKTTMRWLGILMLGASTLQAVAQNPAAGGEQSGVTQHKAVVNRYCATCHNDRLRTGDLVLTQADMENPAADGAIWEKVVSKLRAKNMPPPGVPRPDDATYDSLATYLETELDRASEANPNPGRTVSAHRMNRAEYTNAIRDLLGLEIDGAALLPSDDSGGFDNLGSLLSISPGLMEKYMSVAGKISRLAVGDTNLSPDVFTYPVSPYLVQGDRMSEDLPFGSRGGTAVRHHFPLDGEYVLKARLQRTDGSGYIIGIAEPQYIDVRMDHARVELLRIGGENLGLSEGSGAADAVPPHFEQSQYERNADDELEVRFTAKAGTRLVQVTFLKENAAHESVFSPISYDTLQEATLRRGNERGGAKPSLSSFSISGPFDTTGPGDTPSREKIFVCSPANEANEREEASCARKIIASLARRAYRRPVTDADVDPLAGLFEAGRETGTFEDGIQMAVQGLLVSTDFLFRIYREPETVKSGAPYQLNDLDLASRLSFFLWSSIPDEELLGLAERDQLNDPGVLEQQVRRMLADPRSRSLVDNFAGQWLILRNVKVKTPNRDVFPEFDDSLREAFEQETELFLQSIFREDRSVLDLIRADYTYLNERLAGHYGIEGVYGNQFRRVAVQDDNRRGLLGQGSILMVTALANRTSPVQRGKWVLENILAEPPPPPPPDIPPLKEKSEGAKGTMRQQMEAHRNSPACMGCHSKMDPIGFALENFDGIGRWRDDEDGNEIDTTGVFPDGFEFTGPNGLRQALLNRPEAIALAVSEKLMMYALGRTLDYYDEPALRKISRKADREEYRWSSIVLGIVESVPFQMRRSGS